MFPVPNIILGTHTIDYIPFHQQHYFNYTVKLIIFGL